MDYASSIFEPKAFLYPCQPRNDMGRQGHQFTSISQGGRLGWGKFPATGIWAQWILAFAGMTRERRLTVLFILSLLNDLQQAISSMEWFYRLTMNV